MEAIKRDFGTFEAMKTQLSASTTAVQGSGWGWLGFNKATQKLQIQTCANQDPLEATTGLSGCLSYWNMFCFSLSILSWLYQQVNGRLQYLQCISSGDTAVLHYGIGMLMAELWTSWVD